MARYEVLVGFNYGADDARAEPGEVLEDLEKVLSDRAISGLRRADVVRLVERGEKTADVRRAARAREKAAASARTAILERLPEGSEVNANEYVPIGAHRAPVTGPFSRLRPPDHPAPEAVPADAEDVRTRGGPSALAAVAPEETPDVVEAPAGGSSEVDASTAALAEEQHQAVEEPPSADATTEEASA